MRSRKTRFIVAWAYKSDLSALGFLENYNYEHRREFFIEDFSKVLPLSADMEFWRKDLTKEILPSGVKMSVNCLVRSYRSGDEVHFADIYNRVWGPYGRQLMSVNSAKRRICSQQIEQVLFVELDGKPVGCIEVDRNGEVNLVGVIPEYQRRGIGTVLLSKTLEHLKQIGRKSSYMDTGVPLKGALALYKKLGYEKVEELYCMVKELT